MMDTGTRHPAPRVYYVKKDCMLQQLFIKWLLCRSTPILGNYTADFASSSTILLMNQQLANFILIAFQIHNKSIFQSIRFIHNE